MNEPHCREPSACASGGRPKNGGDGSKPPSQQSERGLDWLNFFMADVQTGFGAFLSFYLADHGWTQQNIGFALTVGGLSGIACQIPCGALTDAVKRKRLLVALGTAMIATSAVLLALWPTLPIVFAAEALHGATGGIIGPAIGAISLGLVGLALEPMRGILFAIGTAFWSIIVAQVFNGIVSAILVVMTVLVITDLTTGTGRFNFARGALGTCTGIAAAISTSVTGVVAGAFGSSTALWLTAGVAALAAAVLWLLLPESKPQHYLD